MQHLEVSGAVRHIYVIRRLKVNAVFPLTLWALQCCSSVQNKAYDLLLFIISYIGLENV